MMIGFHCRVMGSKSLCAFSRPARLFSASSAEGSPPRKVCDPYGQDGKPLPEDEVAKLLTTLEPGWAASDGAKSISRTFSCKSLVSPVHHPSSVYTFVDTCANLSNNFNHHPYKMTIVPRRCSVEITLKTIPLKGLSYQDFLLATQFDIALMNQLRSDDGHNLMM